MYIGGAFLYPSRMNFSRHLLAGLTLAVLAGCASAPPQPAEGPAACPEPVTCPVCEPPPEPLECPPPQVVEKVVRVPVPAPAPVATTAGDMHLPIIGAVEYATVEPAGLVLEARVDTGAETCSIYAEDIQLVEKEGKRYVRFSLVDDQGNKVPQEIRLHRRVIIKQEVGEPERRYAVRMWITLGEIRSRVDVNLSDRKDFEYPLLIGRNFLLDAAIVDVSRQHTQPH